MVHRVLLPNLGALRAGLLGFLALQAICHPCSARRLPWRSSSMWTTCSLHCSSRLRRFEDMSCFSVIQ